MRLQQQGFITKLVWGNLGTNLVMLKLTNEGKISSMEGIIFEYLPLKLRFHKPSRKINTITVKTMSGVRLEILLVPLNFLMLG